MTLGESIRRGTKWLLAGRIGNRATQFVFGVILARLLAPADFGMLVTVQIFTGVAGFVAGGGMGQALVQAKIVEERDYQVVFTLQIIICTVIYIAFYSIAPSFADWFGVPLYKDLLRVSALSFFMRPFMNIANSRLHRDMRFKAVAAISFIGMSLSGVVSIVMAFYGMGVWSLVVSPLVCNVPIILLLLRIVDWVPSFGLDREVAKRMGSYGIKVSINDMLEYLKMQTSKFVVSRMMGPAMVGLYNKADSLAELPQEAILGSTFKTVFRAMSSVQDDKDLSKYLFYRTITLSAVYALPFYVALWWFAEPFIRVVYGQKWLGAAEPLQILALIGILLVSSSSGALIAAQNMLSREIWINIESWFLLAVGCMVGIHWGLSGVAWAFVVYWFYINVRLYLLAQRIVGGRGLDLLRSLRPAYVLNAMLFVGLLLSDFVVFRSVKTEFPTVYIFGMGGVGVLLYVGMVLYLPIAELRSEADRWRSTLESIAPWKKASGQVG